MAEIVRLTESSEWIDLGFVERERTPKPLMELGIRLHLAGLSLPNTVSELEKFGVDRSRKTVHDCVKKADLQPDFDPSPNHIALDETVIRIDSERYWLYTAADPATNEILLTRLYPARTTVLTERFLQELQHVHDVEDATFLVDGAPWLQTVLQRHGLRFRHETHGNRNAIERVYTEVKRRTSSFDNTVWHADPETAENWLIAHAAWHNSLNQTRPTRHPKLYGLSNVDTDLTILHLTNILTKSNGRYRVDGPIGDLRRHTKYRKLRDFTNCNWLDNAITRFTPCRIDNFDGRLPTRRFADFGVLCRESRIRRSADQGVIVVAELVILLSSSLSTAFATVVPLHDAENNRMLATTDYHYLH